MSRYKPAEFPDWTERPWHFPGILWRAPWWPVRLYLHIGDRILFAAWEATRPVVWRLEDFMGSSYSADGLLEDRDA